MKCILLAVLLWGTCAQASPQDIAISGMAGVGRANGEAEDIRSQFFPTGGASLNLKIGRPEIKLDYEYVAWDRRGSLHLVSAGWFIQSRPKLLRPFFQLGWAVGLEKYTTQGYRVVDGSTLVVNRDVTQGFQGLAMGGGFTTAFREQFFMRPELRWKLIGPGPMMLIVPVLSFGYRF